jgi:hypothetical protein
MVLHVAAEKAKIRLIFDWRSMLPYECHGTYRLAQPLQKGAAGSYCDQPGTCAAVWGRVCHRGHVQRRRGKGLEREGDEVVSKSDSLINAAERPARTPGRRPSVTFSFAPVGVMNMSSSSVPYFQQTASNSLSSILGVSSSRKSSPLKREPRVLGMNRLPLSSARRVRTAP